MNILGVCGSTHQESHSLTLLNEILGPIRAEAVEVRLLNLLTTPLPLFRSDGSYSGPYPEITQIRQWCEEADAFVLVSPEYHGSMSGWMKNFFDFHYHEFAGKLFGLAATTGGSQGISCLTHMRAAVQYCHGWSLPYQTAATEKDFDAVGQLQNPRITDRLHLLGRDILIYGQLLRQQFQQDRQHKAESPSLNTGFAGWYR